MQEHDFECGNIAVPEELTNNRKLGNYVSGERHYINSNNRSITIDLLHGPIVTESLVGVVRKNGVLKNAFSFGGQRVFCNSFEDLELSNFYVDYDVGELSFYSNMPLNDAEVIVNYEYINH